MWLGRANIRSPDQDRFALNVLLLENKITDHSAPRQDGRRTVVHVRTAVGAGGGADKTTLKSPYYLRGSRYRAAAVYFRSAGDTAFAALRERAKQWRCPLFQISDHGAFDLTVVVKLHVICRQLHAQILHAHEYKSNIVGLVVGRLLGLKLVSTVHGWVERSPKLDLFYKADVMALRRFDRVVAVSTDLYDACLAKGVDRSRLRLVHNGIELERYRRRGPPDEARRQWPGSPGGRAGADAVVIGAVGRLSEEKGLRFLIEAFATLHVANPNIELWIAGDGKLGAALKEHAARCGAGDRVYFLGHVADTIGIFDCFDLYCLPSLREGLPNTLLEALAMEVAVVATTVGGIPAVLHDGIDSRLVEPGSADALANALAELIADRPQRSRLAAAGRDLVERDFSFRKRMQRMIAVYDELYEPAHRGPGNDPGTSPGNGAG